MSLNIIRREFEEAAIPALCLFVASTVSFSYILPTAIGKSYSPGAEILCYLVAMCTFGLIFGISQGTRLHPNPDGIYLRLPISPDLLFISRFAPVAVTLLTLQILISMLLLNFPHTLGLEAGIASVSLMSYSIGRLISRFSQERTMTFFIGIAFVSLIYYLSHLNFPQPLNYALRYESINFGTLSLFGFLSCFGFYFLESKRPSA